MRSRTGRRRAAAAGALLLAATMFLSADTPGPFRDRFSIFFGNLHSHTALSDGSGFPLEAYDHAKSEGGLDFMALTEHNHTSNIKPKDPKGGDTIGTDHSLYSTLKDAARRKTRNASFIALFGQEFSSISSGNHLNVFGASDVIDDEEISNGSYKQLYEEWLPAHPEVQFLQFNHPWELQERRKNYGLHQFHNSMAKLREAVGPFVRTIEVFNGPGLTDGSGLEAPFKGEGLYRFYLTRGFRLAPSADQDNHHRTWGTLTGARTGVLAAELSRTALVEAIQARRCYASADKNLRVWFGVNGEIMGSEITAASRQLKVSYTVEDPDEPGADYKVVLVTGNPNSPDSAREVTLEPRRGDHSAETDLRASTSSVFVYLKLTQHPRSETKKNIVLTSPVWIDIP